MSEASQHEALTRALAVVEANAARVDREAVFPTESVEALRNEGFLGLLMPAELGGGGQPLRAAAAVVEQLAQACASTAMVMVMHYTASAKLGAFGPRDVKQGIASGKLLASVALSEPGSRSHFWAPLSTARETPEGIRLDGPKSWVTSSAQADVLVWSSKSVGDPGKVTLWAVANPANGLSASGPFDGLGLRGNHSTPMRAEGLLVAVDRRMGEDGAGFDILMNTGLPAFNILSSACSVGITRAAYEKTVRHVQSTRLDHLGQSLAQLPTIRAYLARMRIKTESARLLLQDTLTAAEQGRSDTLLRVIEVKAFAGETATEVTDLAMRVCGGAAFRKEVAVERHLRDARAATVMAPTTDALYDFLGRAIVGLPLFD